MQGRCAQYLPTSKIITVRSLDGFLAPRRCRVATSLLPQRFADPALGELVLAGNALCVDAQQHIDAVPCPLGHLGWVDAAVEPRGQAGVPEVIWPPGER
jgi:hypothetical protein